MAIARGIDIDLVALRKEFVIELIDLRKQYQEEYLKWAAEKLAAARKEFGSQSTEELGGYQVLPCSKTPRVGRTTQKRPCVETPNENDEAEHTTLEMHKKEEETKRVTRTSSRRTLAEVNTNQPPLTAAEPQPAPEKKPARGGRRKKVVEDPVTVPTRRTTRAASRRAAAAAVKVVVLESDEEVAGSTESEAVPMEEDLSSQPSSHCVTDDTDDEAGVRTRTKVSFQQSTRSRRRASNQKRKGVRTHMSRPMRSSSCVSPPPSSSPLKVTLNSPLPKDVEEDCPVSNDTEVGNPLPEKIKEDSPLPKGTEEDCTITDNTEKGSPLPKKIEEATPLPKDIEDETEPTVEEERPVLVLDASPPTVDPRNSEAPVEDEEATCEVTEKDTESCRIDVTEGAKGLTDKKVSSVHERVEVATPPAVEDNGSVPLSPDLLTPYMKNSPFQLTGCRGGDSSESTSGEHCRRGTFLLSAGGEDKPENTGDGAERNRSTGVGHAHQTDDQTGHSGDQNQKSAQRKAVMRSFFLPLERTRLGGGNVARMVRDIEGSSTTPLQQREAVVESKPLSSSSTRLKVPPSSVDEQRKRPPSSADEHSKVPPCSADKGMEQFFSSLLAKTAPKKRSSGVSAPSRQPQEAAVPAPPRTPPLTETPEAGSMTHSELSSFFDSLLRKKKPSRGASSGSEKESKEQGKVQETSPSLQEMSPRLKKHRSGDSVEEYLTADERDNSMVASPLEVIREGEHSKTAQGSGSDGCSEEPISPEGTSEESPPGGGSDGQTPASLPQPGSSSAGSASWQPEYWEAWHARNIGEGSKPALLRPGNRAMTFLQSSSSSAASYSSTSATAVTGVSSPKKKQGVTGGASAKLNSHMFLSLLKTAYPQKEPQTASSSVMSFLPCPSSPAKNMNQNERKHELKQRIEEKDRKVKEFELQKHKELRDKFKKQKERALLVSQRRAQLEEEEEAKRLQQLAKKEDLFSKKRTNLLSKKQKELEDLRRKQDEQLQAVQLRKKQQEVEFQKKLQAQLEEEQKVAAENEKKRLEYEEREKQRRKVEDDRKRKAGEHFGEEPAKKQGCEHRDDSNTANSRKVPVPVTKPQNPHPLGNTFIKPPPYQLGNSGSGSSKLPRPGFASPAKTAVKSMTAQMVHSFISPQLSSYSQPKRHPMVTSYAMTPDVFNQVESYDIEDLSSSDDTEDEETTTKPIPLWAQPQALKKALLEQESKTWDIESIFPAPKLPIDLVSIFGRKRKRYHYRTSSVNWDTPPKAKKKYYV